MKKAFQKLVEDGKVTKEQLRKEIEVVKQKQKGKKNKKGSAIDEAQSRQSEFQRPQQRKGILSFICGANRSGPSKSQVMPSKNVLREQMREMALRDREDSTFSNQIDNVQVQLPRTDTSRRRQGIISPKPPTMRKVNRMQ